MVPVDGGVELRDGELLVAEARPVTLALEVPDPPATGRIEAAAGDYLGFRSHPFPTCFVCGPQRGEGDGLRIFAARVPGTDLVAATWTPDASLADERGQGRPEHLWAALDCPGAFAAMVGPEFRPMVLGRMTASLAGTLAAGEPCAVIGWSIESSGRKHRVGTALFDADRRCVGRAEATWIELAPRA